MGFFNALLACLVALWLTGNIQPGSPIGSIVESIGWFLVVLLIVGVGGYIWIKVPGAIRDFRSGKLKF